MHRIPNGFKIPFFNGQFNFFNSFVIKLPVLKERNIQFKCWEYCFQAQMRVKNAKFH